MSSNSSSLVWNLIARNQASPAIDGVRGSFERFGKFASTALIGAATAASGFAVAGVAAGVKTAASMEQAQIGFTTLLGSSQKAKAYLQDLSNFAAATPFDLPGLIQSSRLLIGVGLNTVQTKKALQDFGDASSALGLQQDAFQRIMLATSQAISAGKFQTQDLNQITENGIPVWKLLADATGKPVPELRKLASAGKLLTSDVLPTLEKQMHKDYGGAMVKQSQTLNGMWSTFMDTLNQGLGKAIAPLIPALDKGLAGATIVVQKALAGIPNVVNSVSERFKALGIGSDTVHNALSGIASAVQSVAGFLLHQLIPTVQSAVQRVLPLFEDGLHAITSAFHLTSGQSEALHKSLNTIWQFLKTYIIPIMAVAAGALFQTLGHAIQLTAQLILVVIIPAIAHMLTNLQLMIRGAINAGVAIGHFIAGMVNGFRNGYNSVNDWLLRLQNSIHNRFASAGHWLLSAGASIIQGLGTGMFNAARSVNSWISSIGTSIVNAVKRFFGIHSPSTVFQGLGVNMLQGLIKGMASIHPTQFIGKVFGSMPKALGSIVQKGLIGITDLPGKALSALGGLGSSLLGLLHLGGGGGGNKANRGIGQMLAQAYGWGTGPEWNALNAVVMRESGWNNNAQNPTSTAYGIFQFLNSTWGAYGGSKTSNPAEQIRLGLRYIAERYGDPIGAEAHEIRYGWYDNGGVLKPGYTLAFNGTGSDEYVTKSRSGGDTYVLQNHGVISTDDVESWFAGVARNVKRKRGGTF